MGYFLLDGVRSVGLWKPYEGVGKSWLVFGRKQSHHNATGAHVGHASKSV